MEEYKSVAVGLARKAGEIMRKNFTLGMKKEWKEDRSPVTDADIAINAMVVEEIRGRFPDHDIIGEEQSDRREGVQFAWVCDPVDGTIPFSHGIPLGTFVLALCRDGTPILGVIYDPFMDRMFVGEKGKGAFCNDKRISVSSAQSLEDQFLELDLPTELIPYDVRPLREELNEKGATCLKMAASCYGGMLVACGELAATVATLNTCWDGVALKIIVEEAGGKVTDIFGNEQRYDRPINGFVTSNGLVHDELLEMIRSVISAHEI